MEDLADVEAAIPGGQDRAREVQVGEHWLQGAVGQQAAEAAGLGAVAGAVETAGAGSEAGELQDQQAAVRPSGHVDGHVQAVHHCALVALLVDGHQLAAPFRVGAAPEQGDQVLRLAVRPIHPQDAGGHGFDGVPGLLRVGQVRKAVDEDRAVVRRLLGHAVLAGVGDHGHARGVVGHVEGVDQAYIVPGPHGYVQVLGGEGLRRDVQALLLLLRRQGQDPEVAGAEVAHVEAAAVWGEADQGHPGQVPRVPGAGEAADEPPGSAVGLDEADAAAVIPAAGALLGHQQAAVGQLGHADGPQEAFLEDGHLGLVPGDGGGRGRGGCADADHGAASQQGSGQGGESDEEGGVTDAGRHGVGPIRDEGGVKISHSRF